MCISTVSVSFLCQPHQCQLSFRCLRSIALPDFFMWAFVLFCIFRHHLFFIHKHFSQWDIWKCNLKGSPLLIGLGSNSICRVKLHSWAGELDGSVGKGVCCQAWWPWVHFLGTNLVKNENRLLQVVFWHSHPCAIHRHAHTKSKWDVKSHNLPCHLISLIGPFCASFPMKFLYLLITAMNLPALKLNHSWLSSGKWCFTWFFQYWINSKLDECQVILNRKRILEEQVFSFPWPHCWELNSHRKISERCWLHS